MNKAFETKLNILLSEILNERLGIKSIAETRRGAGRQPDILIFIGGIKIVFEGSYSRSDAISDIKKKIEGDYGDIGVAVFYKDQIPDTDEVEVKARLIKSKFDLMIVAKDDISNTLLRWIKDRGVSSKSLTGWEEVDIIGLASVLRNIKDFLVREELISRATDEIEVKIRDFVDKMTSIDTKATIAGRLYDLYYKLNGLYYGNYADIADIIYAQAYLTLLLSVAFYYSVQASLGLEGLYSLKSRFGTKGGLSKAFEDILKVDYQPIYSLANQVISNIPPELLDSVFETGVKLGSSTTLLKNDFSGKIYHKIVGDWQTRKGFATYFTTIPASYLLSSLALFSEFSPIKNADEIKLCDFACGSGTLLIASYSVLSNIYILENFEKGSIDLTEFHMKVAESNIWGFDALRYALHIASLNLVFQSPTTPLRGMNFYTMPLGKGADGNIVLGSLKYLETGVLQQYFADTKLKSDRISSKESAMEEMKEEEPNIPKFNLVIMNPPFTRATGRGGKANASLFGFILDTKVREAVMNEYLKLRKKVKDHLMKGTERYLKLIKEPAYKAIGPAGEGILFVYLASKHLANEGKIAFVLPKSMLTGVSWFLIRAYLLSKFHIEYIVVSYDKGNGYNFSESTSLSEVLIVARQTEWKENPTKFICLLNKPKTSFEAIGLSKMIIKGKSHASYENSHAIMNYIDRKEMEENVDNWGRFVAFPSFELSKYSLSVSEGKLGGKIIKMAKLGDLAKIGVDRHQFRNYFREDNSPGSYLAIIGGEEENRSNLVVEPNKRITSIKSNGTKVFKEFSSKLMVPDRIRINTAHYLALYSLKPAMSNIFYSVRLIDRVNEEKKLKALALWLNSVWGVISILSNREETEGGWISLKLTQWRSLNVIDVSQLNYDKLSEFETIFEEHKLDSLRRLIDQFDIDNPDPERKKIDLDVAKVIGIDISEKELEDIYRLIHESFTVWL